MRLLIVEDNERLASSLARGFREEGFESEICATAGSAVERVAKGDLDAVILDLGLPDLDGTAVLEAARAGGSVVPILVLTARDAVSSRVAALDAGADDYVLKPFAFEELLARVRALVRRASAPRWAPLAVANLVLEPVDLIARVDGAAVRLSPREHALLSLLLRRRGEVLPRRTILEEVFGYTFDPGTNVTDVHVGHLRRKLAAAHLRIETVRGVGYRLVEARDG